MHIVNAGVAELVDALDSKSSDGNIVRVQVSPSVPALKKSYFNPSYDYRLRLTVVRISL